jgi:beta-galactosidase GanA
MNKKLIEWVNADDASEIQDDKIVSYHCISSGVEELEYIITRLREVYAVGGAVSKITIESVPSQFPELIPGTKDALDNITIRAT